MSDKVKILIIMRSKQFQVSHYPKGYKQERIAGMGLNEEELKRNPVNDINNPVIILCMQVLVILAFADFDGLCGSRSQLKHYSAI